jgi:lysine 2,3-aminomutase
MENWKRILAASVTDPEELARSFPIHPESLRPVIDHYPMRMSPYYLGLIREVGDPIWRQCIPDPLELKDQQGSPDPLNEEGLSPVPGLIHRYSDRVVLLVSSVCSTLCRFCMRKARTSPDGKTRLPFSLKDSLEYIRQNTRIRDVILSGGDPLLLCDEDLEEILRSLRQIPHVEIIRIGTRVPVTLPDRITLRLCRLLKGHHPLYLNTHFNHPSEITPRSASACIRLADAGIPLGNQTVLLRGVNDTVEIMRQLMKGLLFIRVRPYYIHQMDRVTGTSHFRTPVVKGLEIMSGLRGHTSGIGVPYYVIDLPGGKGKVPVLPDDVRREGNTLFLKNYLGEVVEYQDLEEEE